MPSWEVFSKAALLKESDGEWEGKTDIEFLAVLFSWENCHTILIGIPCCEVLHECLGIVLWGRYKFTGWVASRDDESAGWRCLEETRDCGCRTRFTGGSGAVE
jgi:hypothetical protein